MKTSRTAAAGAMLALLIGGQSALADGWSLEKLLPFGKREPGKSARQTAAKPSPLRRFRAEMRKLNAQTKRLFAGVQDALTWKKPAPRSRPTNQYLPWIRPPKRQSYLHPKKKQKESWFDSLFPREEPNQVQSLKDFVGLPRPSP